MTTTHNPHALHSFHSVAKEKWRKSRQIAEDNPFLFLFTSLLAIGAGWIIEKGLDGFLPDAMEAQVRSLQEEIESRTDNISNDIESLQSRLLEAGNKDLSQEELVQIVSEIKTLTGELHSLTPSLTLASEMSETLAERLSAAKHDELRRTRYSGQADLILAADSGVQLCSEGVTLGVNSALNRARAHVILSYVGEEVAQVLDAGQSVSIETSNGLASVSYIGRIGPDADHLYGFNIVCNGSA